MTVRPPTREDAEGIVELVCACDEADYGAPDYDLGALLGEWAEPGVDLERDAWVVLDADGELVAYGLLLGGDGRAWVHPLRLGRGLGSRLAELLEQRARERGLPALAQQVAVANSAARDLLAARGYALTQAFALLSLPADRAAALAPPEGVRGYDPARDEAAVQALIERAFAANRVRADPLESVLARGPDYGLWFVAERDGAVAGALRSELRDGTQGWISEVAADPAHAGTGVGTALLRAAARALAARGAATVGLSVRSSNERALRLYRRLGFDGGWDVEERTKDLTATP
jgi:ribosomal protein S18 acetylase RimI-like enzyme